jgi:16S rRNA G966 N2-methylase RsmD
MISSDGFVVIQHSIRENIEGTQTGTFVLTDQRKYGDTLLSFFNNTVKEKGTHI